MSRFRSCFVLHFTRGEARILCARAIGHLGWRIDEDSDARLVCHEASLSASSPVNPSRIAIGFSSEVDGTTEVTVNAANFGAGPVQSAHVRSQVEGLIRAIEAEASRAMRDRPPGTAAIRRVVVNRIPLLDEETRLLELDVGGRVEDGCYWYDPKSGAWGSEGGATRGFMRSGLMLGGPLRASASNGTTGIFLNGRELDERESRALRKIAAVGPGRYWLNAHGEFGSEGGPQLGCLPVRARIAIPASETTRRNTARRRSAGRTRGRARRDVIRVVPTA